mgnify:CR=1 FL=1
MKHFILGFLIATFISLYFISSKIELMVKNSQMLLCYNAEVNGYFWPFVTYKCQTVKRGSDY